VSLDVGIPEIVMRSLSEETCLEICSSSNPLFLERCFTGTALNPGALVLAHVLMTYPDLVKDSEDILELGCGLGLLPVSLGMHPQSRNKIRSYWVTDGEVEALNLARQNIERNASKEWKDKCTAKQLLWGKENSLESLRQRKGIKFSLIIGTDLVYARIPFAELFQSIAELMQDDGRCLFVYRPRVADSALLLRRFCQAYGLTIEFYDIQEIVRKDVFLRNHWHNMEFALIRHSDAERQGLLENWFPLNSSLSESFDLECTEQHLFAIELCDE